MTTAWFTLRPAALTVADLPPGQVSFPIDVPAGEPDLVGAALADTLTLLGVCEALAGTGNIQDLSDVITRHIPEAFEAMFAGVALREPGGGMLSYLDLAPLPAATNERWRSFPLDGSSPAGAAARDGHRLFHPTRDSVEEGFPGIPGHLETAGIRALANLPLIADGETIGVMTLGWETEQAFDAHQRASLITVASYVSTALRRLPDLFAAH